MSDFSLWMETTEELQRKSVKTFQRLQEIWDHLGIDETTQSKYRKQALSHIEDLFTEMINEAEQREENACKNVKTLMEELDVLQKELHVVLKKQIEYENLPLIKLEELLEAYVSELQELKQQRMSYLNELMIQEEEICRKLGIKPKIHSESIPSEHDIQRFQTHLQEKIEEKNRLENVFLNTRQSILDIMQDLDIKPSTPFECLVCSNQENFVYSSTNMMKLKELHEELENLVKNARAEADLLRENLLSIWRHIDEPKHTYEAFLQKHRDYSVTSIMALKAELKRCKEKRKENVAHYIVKLRGEMVSLWNLCKYSEAQRKEFAAFNSKTYTDDLLNLHEMELEKLRQYYNSNRTIFELLDKREALFIKMKELESRADDPDRFHNRGGQLLMEEKERKVIAKKLPQVEEQLQTAVEKYESVHGEPFLINGRTLDSHLKTSWDQYQEEKENQKKARKEARDKTDKRTLSSSKKTPRGGTTLRTPLGTSKRKISFEVSPTNSTKRRSIHSQKKTPTIVCVPKSRRSGMLARKLIEGHPTARSEPHPTRRRSKSDSHSSEVADASYNEFQRHLVDRAELRSSLMHDKILKSINNKVKTPARTPGKPPRIYKLTPKLSKSASKVPRSPSRVITSKLTPLPGRSIDF